MSERFQSYYHSPAGIIQLTATANAITNLQFVDDTVNQPNHESPILTEATKQLEAYFRGTLKSFSLPLEPAGTPFQLKVWELLGNIPYGQTLSYAALSLQFGDEKAIRAIAKANGANPIPIIIPCHRVIGSNGTLTGYSGGLHRKQWLLDLEAQTNGTKLRLF